MDHISIYRIKTSPNYQCQYTDAAGRVRQVSTRCKTKQDAYRWLTTRKAEEAVRLDKSKLLSAFIADFIADAKAHRATGTVWLYKRALDAFCEAIGDLPIQSITAEHVSKWQGAMKLSGKYSITYINILNRSLKRAFNVARIWKRVSVSPFVDAEPITVPNVDPLYLSIGDKAEVLKHATGIVRDIIIFGSDTGLRSGEMLALKWADVEKNHIIVRNSEDHETKDDETRGVPLTEDARTVIMERLIQARGEYVFHRGGNPLIGSSISHAIKRAIRAAGLNDKLHMHSLRHTCASLLIQNGANINAVKEILGHASLTTTQIYTHNSAESLRREMEKMPRIKGNQ